IQLYMIINGRKILNCPFVIVDLRSQDCIIGIKWLKCFKLKLDTDCSWLIWSDKYPVTYNPAAPILMTLNQPIHSDNVALDIKRCNKLSEQEDYWDCNSPSQTINRICGLICAPKFWKVPFVMEVAKPTPETFQSASKTPLTQPTFQIALLSANAFHFKIKQKQNEFFITSMYEIEQVLEETYWMTPKMPIWSKNVYYPVTTTIGMYSVRQQLRSSWSIDHTIIRLSWRNRYPTATVHCTSRTWRS
ncbi:hypothetical protein BU25DRAFT_355159, partial [Macroventuria anomochaeta]